MNRIAIVLLAILSAASVYGKTAYAADIRLAFVNTAQVLEQAPQAEASRNKLQREFAPRDDELVVFQKKLQALEDKLVRNGAVMAEEERHKLEREILSQQRELKRAGDEFSEDLNIRRNEEFANLQRQIVDTIVAIAREEGYDLVLESGVIYASDRVDISNKLIDRLRQQFEQAGKK